MVENAGVTADDLPPLDPLLVMIVVPPPSRVWSDDEMGKIRQGSLAFDTEAAWFVDASLDRVATFYSVESAAALYEASFANEGGGWVISRLCLDPTATPRRSDDYHAVLVEYLIETLLLGVFDVQKPRRLSDEARMPPAGFTVDEEDPLCLILNDARADFPWPSATVTGERRHIPIPPGLAIGRFPEVMVAAREGNAVPIYLQKLPGRAHLLIEPQGSHAVITADRSRDIYVLRPGGRDWDEVPRAVPTPVAIGARIRTDAYLLGIIKPCNGGRPIAQTDIYRTIFARGLGPATSAG